MPRALLAAGLLAVLCLPLTAHAHHDDESWAPDPSTYLWVQPATPPWVVPPAMPPCPPMPPMPPMPPRPPMPPMPPLPPPLPCWGGGYGGDMGFSFGIGGGFSYGGGYGGYGGYGAGAGLGFGFGY